MKKFAVVISILLLVFCCISALGEGIDLESMTTNELVELQIAVQDELYKRDRFMDCFLNQGEYIIGEEIEPGDYLVHCIDAYGTGDMCMFATIDLETGKDIEHNLRFKADQLHKIRMTEGSKFVLYQGVVELLPID